MWENDPERLYHHLRSRDDDAMQNLVTQLANDRH